MQAAAGGRFRMIKMFLIIFVDEDRPEIYHYEEEAVQIFDLQLGSSLLQDIVKQKKFPCVPYD